MASTPPSTPKSKTSTCPDTQLRHSHTTRAPYLSGDLTETRRAVLNDLEWYRQVPYEQLVRSLFRTLPDDNKIAEIRTGLKDDGLITGDDKQWTSFVTKPSENIFAEPYVFRPLDLIIKHIFEQVPESSFCFVTVPSETPLSTRGNTCRPDAFIRLKKIVHW
ncbi:hypothetical protein OG21DRAFT_781229 [Imleria badia]|nr:hypothetical protein OG21DRAFT_781229 [Imleria badia]